MSIFRYNLRLALLQLKSHRMLTAIIAIAIGLGVGSTMTMFTVIHVLSRDPLPGRSQSLFYPQLDSRPDDWRGGDGPDPSQNLTWIDASNLLAAGHAERQAAMAGGSLLLNAESSTALPGLAQGRYVTPDFFAMFGVPLHAGRFWSAREEMDRARVIVIDTTLSRQLFGTAESVGKQVHAQDTSFMVIGVVDDWAPRPLFYNDVGGKSFGDADAFFMPLHTAVDMVLDTTSNRVCWGTDQNPGLTADRCTWLQFWVELQPGQVAGYRDFLANYQSEQQRVGRFGHRGRADLYRLDAWLKRQDLVPRDVWLQFLLAGCFYLVCLVNIVSLLLTKFMGRAPEVSVRRSLGAPRHAIFVQFTTEASLIGSLGGLVGLALSQVGLDIVRSRPDAYAKMAHTDVSMLLVTLLVAVVGSMLAGAIPAWRAASVAPSLYLKEG